MLLRHRFLVIYNMSIIILGIESSLRRTPQRYYATESVKQLT